MEDDEVREGQSPAAGAGSRDGKALPSKPAKRPWAAEGDLRPDIAREAFRRGEELFRGVFENTAVGMALMDLEGRFIDANPALQRMLGCGGDELRRMSYPGFVHPDDLGSVQEMMDDMRFGRACQFRTSLRFIRRGWVLRWGKMTASLMTGLRAEPPLVVAALEDITEQRLTQESLRTSVARYRDLVDNAAAGVAAVDSDGNLTFVNRALCDLTGYPEEELLGRHFSEFIPPGDLGSIFEDFGTAFDGGMKDQTAEFRLVRKDGRVIHCFTSPTASLGDGGEAGHSAIILDVTGRKRAEGELVKLSTAVRLIRESILIMDTAGNVTYANEATRGLLARDLLADGCWDFSGLLRLPEREKWRLVLAETQRGGSVQDVELVLDTGDGRIVPMEVSTTAMKGADGKPAGIVAILRDITERKHAQRQMRSQLMAFKLEEGCIYLVKESAAILSMEGFLDLLRAGYRGTVLSRTPPRRFSPDSKELFERLWLSDRPTPDSVGPDPSQILSRVDALPRNHAIFIDRLDYLISRGGFGPVLELVHRLREVAYLMGHIVIIGLDPATLDDRGLRALEKETSEMAPRSPLKLHPEQLEIVRYVYERSIAGARPTLTEVGEALRLCKPTARKRSRDAAREGYLVLSPKGRTKVLELTEKGRSVFSK